jgi:hypothetical protein
MDQTARIKAAIAEAVFEQREDLYQRTHNPLHVWHAYVMARHASVPLPSWVVGYFDHVADVLTAPEGPRSPQAIAEALGLRTKGGPSKARQAKTDERNADIVWRIGSLQDFAKTFPDSDPDLADNLGILQRVAEQYHLSLERVLAIYRSVPRSAPRLQSAGAEPASSSRETTTRVPPRTMVKPVKGRQQRGRRSRGANSGSS